MIEPKQMMTVAEMRAFIKSSVKEVGTVRWCDAHDISPPYYYDVMASRKPVTDRLAGKFGYKRITMFVRKEDDEQGQV